MEFENESLKDNRTGNAIDSGPIKMVMSQHLKKMIDQKKVSKPSLVIESIKPEGIHLYFKEYSDEDKVNMLLIDRADASAAANMLADLTRELIEAKAKSISPLVAAIYLMLHASIIATAVFIGWCFNG
jgi:hypothetical protein